MLNHDDLIQTYIRRGKKLEIQGLMDAAIETYRAATSAGQASEAHSRLGHIFMDRGIVPLAITEFRAAAMGCNSPERRLDLVRALWLEGKAEEAEAVVQRILEQDPRSGDGFWLLGRLLSEAGRFAEARAALDRAAALHPDQGVVYYDLVRTFALRAADRPLVNRMLRALRSATATDQRVRLHLALGKACDDLADYGQAMRHFGEANRLKRTLGSFDRNRVEGRINDIISHFTSDRFEAHASTGDSSCLPILVVGMPRSGTTLVEQILSSHEKVAAGDELQFWPVRGPEFLETNEQQTIAEIQRSTASDYLAVLRAIGPHAARVVDKNPFNFLWAGAIHLTFPHALIIHCRRNPIDTCLSAQSTYFRRRDDFSTDPEDLVFYYRNYVRVMAHWRAIVPAQHFVEIDYEALVTHPEEQSRRLIAACGLDWSEKCLRPEDNPRALRTASKWQARQPIHQGAVDRWRRYEAWLGPLRELERDPGPSCEQLFSTETAYSDR